MHSHSHDDAAHSHHHFHNIDRAFAIAVTLNFLFTVAEAVYAILAHSMSLLADAGHNFGDVLGLLFAWIATWLAKKAATARFSYGFKRTTIIAALANALILVATSAIIVFQSIYKLFYPSNINEKVVIVVALVGIIINGGTALLFIRGHDDINIKGAFLHLAYDALISVGVVIAGIVIAYTGWVRLDSFVGVGIVIVIMGGAWGLLRNSVNLMLDAVPHFIDQERVRQYLINCSGVQAIHDLHIWGLSTNEIALTAHLVIPQGELSDHDHQKINTDLQNIFKINHVTLQVERGTTENPCGQAITC